MKPLIISAIFLLLALVSPAQQINPDYDSTLAARLGADERGMKGYILAILKTGSNTTASKAFTDSCFRGHMENITRMADDGKLIVAGPIRKNEMSYRGIFILNVTDTASARMLLLGDPAIKERLLDAELYHWYGSAALPMYMEADDRVWKRRQ